MGLRATLSLLFLLPACSFDPPDLSADVEGGFPFVAYWSFDGDTSDATGTHDGSLVRDATLTSDGRGFGGGEALELFRDGDRLDIANPTRLDFNSDFTWHAYIQTTQRSGALFSRNPAAGEWNQGSKALFVRDRRVQWDTGWVDNLRTNVEINDGEWHQVIVTYTAASDAFEIFVDPSVGDRAGLVSATHEVNAYDEHTHEHNGGRAETGFTIGQGNITDGLDNLDTLG